MIQRKYVSTKQSTKGKIIIPADSHPWPHELKVARILATAGHIVEFLPTAKVKTADILLDGVEFEIKSPEHFNSNTLEHTIKDALKQSPNLIIDMLRLKKMRSDKMRNFLINQARKSKQIKRILLITRQGQIIDIRELV